MRHRGDKYRSKANTSVSSAKFGSDISFYFHISTLKSAVLCEILHFSAPSDVNLQKYSRIIKPVSDYFRAGV